MAETILALAEAGRSTKNVADKSKIPALTIFKVMPHGASRLWDITLLVASFIMYYLEGEKQPDAFPNILAAFWWAIATLTTVGYGDVYPVTALGKLLSGLIAIMGRPGCFTNRIDAPAL